MSEIDLLRKALRAVLAHGAAHAESVKLAQEALNETGKRPVVVVAFDNNLNAASWEMIELLGRFGPVSGSHFNHMKVCLQQVIEHYLERRIAGI